MEFAPHEKVQPTPYEKALEWIIDLHFPLREKYDQRQLFATELPRHDVHNTFIAPGDAEVIQRFSNFGELPEGDEILTP